MIQKYFFNSFRSSMYKTSAWFDRTVANIPLVSIFCYHSIADDGWDFSVSTEMLKKQIEHLLTIAVPITEKDIGLYVQGKKNITKPSFLITLDDGYSNVINAFSLFSLYGVKPLLFVVGNPEQVNRVTLQIDKPLLSREELVYLSRYWDIGSHSLTHSLLTEISSKAAKKEIISSKQSIEKVIGRSIRSFSYPKGYYNQSIQDVVEKAGYDLAFSMDDEIIHPFTDRYSIPRIGVSHYHGLEEFKTLSSPTNVRLRKSAKFFMKEQYA